MSSFENFVKCRVVSPLAANATDIALYDAVAPFNLPPLDGGVLVLTDSPNNPSVIEVIRYSYRNALGLYGVQRGQEGTAAVAWSGPVYCYQSLMADDFQALLDSKVDKAAGQSLMLDAERSKLAGIAPGAQVNSVNSVNGKTGAVALVKADVGLGNADNTSDANKPVSTAQQAALDTKVDKVTGKGLSTNDLTAALLTKLNGAAPLASPVFTGSPKAPTQLTTDNSTLLATTAFVQAVVAALVNGAPGALDQLSELAAAMGNDPNFATTMLNALALKAPLASPALTGNPTAPTPAADDNDTSIATTAFVRAVMALFGAGTPRPPFAPGVDANTMVTTGLFYVQGANLPGGDQGSWFLRVDGADDSSGRATQEAERANSVVGDGVRVYRRRAIGGVWTPWQEALHTGNTAVGGVSLPGTAFYEREFSVAIPPSSSVPIPGLHVYTCDILLFGLTAATGSSTNFVGRFSKASGSWVATNIYGYTGSSNQPSIAVVDGVPHVVNNHPTSTYTFVYRMSIAIQSSGVARPFEFFSKLWHDGNLVKQASAVDTTVGALMATGAFGWGSNTCPSSSGNADDILTGGFFWLNVAATGKPESGSGLLFVIPGATTSTTAQWFFGSRTGGGAPGVYYRQKNYGDSTWQPWTAIFHRGNILGTVSQSAGVPTGAIIERGSNANGEYVRYADGTQECWKSTLSSSASRSAWGTSTGLYQSANTAWQYPAPFIDTPVVTGTSYDSGAVGLLSATNIGTANVNLRAISPTPSPSSQILCPVVKGRWY